MIQLLLLMIIQFYDFFSLFFYYNILQCPQYQLILYICIGGTYIVQINKNIFV